RQVDLSDNIFHFSMPENFSKDMPAANMVEKLDIEDLKKFDNPEYGNIIRRWWDIKKPGFFGKELGTVMMDISVQQVPDNKQKLIHANTYNIADRLDFLLILDENLRHRYKKIKSEIGSNGDDTYVYSIDFCSLYGKELESFYRDKTYNHQKWAAYTVTAPLNQLIVGQALPLTKYSYLEVVFTYSPNQNIASREFLDIAYITTQPIEKSLQVVYKTTNEIKKLVEQEWISQTNDDVLAEHYDEILVPLFGPDIHRRMEESKKKALEVQKEMNQPLDE
ncbi:MAG: hypothetical protein K0Q78_2197, partial [Cellvibrio sp.]|nr:hypothetical protein [Cellvibrio sp.]